MPVVVGQITLAIYALLLQAGGVIGYKMAGSKASLIAGIVSGQLEVIALFITFFMPAIGFGMGAGVAVALTLLFIFRFLKTKRLMPSGMLAVVSLLTAILLFVQYSAVAGR